MALYRKLWTNEVTFMIEYHNLLWSIQEVIVITLVVVALIALVLAKVILKMISMLND